MPPDDAPRDFVDALTASWAANRPDVDVAPVAVATRLARLRDYFEGEMAGVLGSFGLTHPAFVMLATLMRLNGPATPESLATELGLTAPTIGMRVDRLAHDGLVTRTPEGMVELTARGRDLAEQVVPAHLASHARLLSALSAEEQAGLAGLLRKLLLAIEG